MALHATELLVDDLTANCAASVANGVGSAKPCWLTHPM